jgi:hypothetical protein
MNAIRQPVIGKGQLHELAAGRLELQALCQRTQALGPFQQIFGPVAPQRTYSELGMFASMRQEEIRSQGVEENR